MNPWIIGVIVVGAAVWLMGEKDAQAAGDNALDRPPPLTGTQTMTRPKGFTGAATSTVAAGNAAAGEVAAKAIETGTKVVEAFKGILGGGGGGNDTTSADSQNEQNALSGSYSEEDIS